MINQDQFREIYGNKSSSHCLLDVRTAYEFADHHLPGSINIPIEELADRFKEISADLPVVTICEHGVRSGIAEIFLKEQGYRADSLQNGLSRWNGPLQLQQHP